MIEVEIIIIEIHDAILLTEIEMTEIILLIEIMKIHETIRMKEIMKGQAEKDIILDLIVDPHQMM